MKEVMKSISFRPFIIGALFCMASPDCVAQEQGFTNGFSFRLMDEVGTEQTENVVLSPLSVHFGLSVLQNGARGNTQAEILRVLGADDMDAEELNAYNRALCEKLLEEPPYQKEDLKLHSPWDELPIVRISNAVWVDEAYSVRPQFSGAADYWYGADIERVDFADASVMDKIHDWYSLNTDGHITSAGEEADAETAMMLTSTILFEGKWTEIFPKKYTHDAEFRNADGSLVKLPTLYTEGTFNVNENDDFYMVKLLCFPQSSGRYSMSLYLPRHEDAVLDLADYEELQGGVREEPTKIYLPKFTVRQDVRMRGVLESLGLHDAFSPFDADFTQLIRSGADCPYLDEINQTCEITVHEYGVSAVAASSYWYVGWGPIDGQIIRFDRPFFYTIEDGATNTILFLGKVNRLEGELLEPDKGVETGIEGIDSADTKSQSYRLDGRRADDNTHGIVIENGRKVLK